LDLGIAKTKVPLVAPSRLWLHGPGPIDPLSDEVVRMLFMIAGYFKPDAEGQLVEFRNEFNEHLAQAPLIAVGALRAPDGDHRGYMGFIEAADADEAERFLKQSPFFAEGLYERVEVFQYELEVGQIR
jgi:uncharacterized protein YciI